MKIFILGLLFSGLLFAQANDLKHRPKSFDIKAGAAVFVDFQTADYEIVYDAIKKEAFVTASMKFFMPENGHPIFDSFEAPLSVELNGEKVQAIETLTPSSETTVRVINKILNVGNHRLVVMVPLKTLVEFTDGGVKSAFWTSDLNDRRYLERYMPANLEYDQIKMTFNITFIGGKKGQKIYTNGVTTAKSKNSFEVKYPDYFNASSIFFHTVPENSTEEINFNLKSLDGREVPVVIYIGKSLFGGFNSLERLKNQTTEIFHELESDYGAWPHPSIVIYNAGSGGMEYAGATMTSVSALGHELFHSYFARGVMPANGNAGWLDEALASWRDEGYKSSKTLIGSSRMSGHPYYTRSTDRAAYSFGERFMSYLDGKLTEKGGLKPFMRYMIEKRIFAPLHVEDFINEMNSFYGVSVDADFKKYTFGTKNNFNLNINKHNLDIHRKMDLTELHSYL